MPMMDCRDILDAVYLQVCDSYIAYFYSSDIKSKTVSESHDASENLKKTETSEPVAATTTTTKQSANDFTETVKSGVERSKEEDVRSEIRLNVQEKFPYALATVCANLARLDKMYRRLKGLEEQPKFSEYFLDVGDTFPLSDRFVFPCIMFVSSIVLMDINEKRSDKYYKKYVETAKSIALEIPCEIASIVEKYPY